MLRHVVKIQLYRRSVTVLARNNMGQRQAPASGTTSTSTPPVSNPAPPGPKFEFVVETATADSVAAAAVAVVVDGVGDGDVGWLVVVTVQDDCEDTMNTLSTTPWSWCKTHLDLILLTLVPRLKKKPQAFYPLGKRTIEWNSTKF